jgi:hypothetical protein
MGIVSPESSPALGADDWRLILRRIRSEKCVPFLGAGASLGNLAQPGLPTARRLAQTLAEECNYPGTDRTDFLRVAQYYTMAYDAHELRDSIRRQLRVRDLRPGLVHKTIAALPVPYVLTTNFDNLMERAFEEAGKSPQVAWYEIHGNIQELQRATVQEPLVYKLHGSLEKPNTMVATEDDVIEFLSCLLLGDPGLPAVVKQLFEQASLLFVGYGLKDWNIRVLLRALRLRRIQTDDIACFAIQRRPDEPSLAAEWEKTVMYWGKRESLKCFDMDALQFVDELHQRFSAEEGLR